MEPSSQERPPESLPPSDLPGLMKSSLNAARASDLRFLLVRQSSGSLIAESKEQKQGVYIFIHYPDAIAADFSPDISLDWVLLFRPITKQIDFIPTHKGLFYRRSNGHSRTPHLGILEQPILQLFSVRPVRFCSFR
ncbi:hypothetical protein CDAR_181191 [Caerostris darwini]|uniref:Uncharacterized protein n=1 Tax=Caerostris darwini TaxID=1538125 RepID=A0AAV4U3W5_9ARAC|nr:hypothetical protein CDAR_181191 [Caerostris darwini]